MPARLLSVFVAALIPISAMAERRSEPLQSGDPIPDASLATVEGGPVSLRKLVSEKPAVIVFYRGGWCPYCTRHLQSLASIEEDLLAEGFQLLAISPDQPSKLREAPDRDQLKYTLLSDSSMEAAKAFGIAFEVDAETRAKYRDYGIDLAAASGHSHHLLPHPAVFVVGKDGVIRFAHVNEDYKIRLAPEKILETARKTD